MMSRRPFVYLNFATEQSQEKAFVNRFHILKDEQERVQKKTFTNWMNTYLCHRKPPIKVEDLFEEVKDGVVLLSLLEVLSGERLPMEKGPKLRRPHHLANIATALNFLAQKKIKLVNINATSIADGKSSIVLGLVWTIILHFQIEETINTVPAAGEADSKKRPTLPKKGLLDWAENVLSKKYGVHVTDFGKSWRDGMAIGGIIHNIRPDLVDMDEYSKQEARVNLEHAFSTAEKHLGIPRLLDPEDVDVEKPDEKSIMTYVAQFLKAYPGGGTGVPGINLETSEKEMKAYNSLMNWLNNEAKEILATTQEPVTDRESEFMDYLGFNTELERREPLYLKLSEKVLSGRSLRITKPELEKLESCWLEVDEQTRQWLGKLDACFPGKLGKLGHWLYEAEQLVKKKEKVTDDVDQMAVQFAELSQEHKEFFKALDEWNQFFAQIKRAGRYEGISLHGPQFEHMSKRLETVTANAKVRESRLDYNLARYKLLASLMLTEAKLDKWTAKYGKEESVEDLLADFVDFVDRQNMVKNLDKIQQELLAKAEKYKAGLTDKGEVASIDRFQEDVTGRCKKVSSEIKTVRPMLEEVIMTWKRFRACVDVLTAWLTEGEQVMMQSLDVKEEFFKNLAQYDEKHQILNTSGNFIIDVSNETTAIQTKQTLQLLNKRFANLIDGYSSFRQHEVIGKARAEYENGIKNVENWLVNASEVVDCRVKCIHADLKAYLLELDEYSNQMQDVENSFKVTTRTAQSLVKDSTPEVVNSMLQTLNVQKEIIVKLKKEVPEKIKYLKAVLPNVESLETGVLDLQNWLLEGEQLLKSHLLDGSPDKTDARLERHKTFFTGITYQKSILESKNKVFQKIIGTKSKLENVDFSPAEDLVNSVNERFQLVVTSSKEWERKLELLVRLWRSLQQRQHELEEWLEAARSILEDNEDDGESLIHKHKVFFAKANKHLLSDYESVANEILQQLSPAEQNLISQRVNHMKEMWENVLHLAPIRLVKLEFTVPEEKFQKSVEVAEQALHQQQEQIRQNHNVKEALAKHKQMFQDGSLMLNCEQWLEQMKNLSEQLLKLSREEQVLTERYREHLDRWKKLKMNAETTHVQLKQLPERWKEYNEKMTDVSGWIQNSQNLLKSLNQEGLTSDEYKEILAKFQKEMRNVNKYQDSYKWLEQALEELIKDAPEADSRRERQRLQELLNKFSELKPNMDSALDKSGVLSKGYEYRDNVEGKLVWLDDAQKLASERPAVDSLEDARAYLSEHETLLNKLEAERGNIQAELEAGRKLQRERAAPDFVEQSVSDLDKKWKDTNDVARSKLDKLKGQVKDWENYESEKARLVTFMKKAEDELDKPADVLNQENAQRDLEAKRELQKTLNDLKGSLTQMTKLNALLAMEASPECQGQFRGEMSDFDKKLESVSHRLNSKLEDLESTVTRWNEFYKRLNSFSDWLNEKEARLNEIYENKGDSPDLQLQKAEGIASQVYENHVTLENLEKDAKGLTQNFRSRESASLKSKLTSIRRQWESLCSRARDKNDSLSGNLAHWQKYQTLQEQLMPWLLKAEKYCNIELPKCSSLEEAKELHGLHQAFLKECEENLPIFDQLNTEAGYLIDQPDTQRDLETIRKRWGNVLSKSEDRSHKVDKIFGAWSDYGRELESFQEKLDKIHNRLSTEPNVNTSDVQVLEHEVVLAKDLQEEVRSHQSQLNALNRQFEQVQSYASPEGLKVLKSKQDAISRNWNDVNSAVTERQKVLASALQHRKNFYDRLQDSDKWIKGMQRKLDFSSEIYSDEIAETKAKLQSMKNECKSQDDNFQSLHQEFKELMAVCNDDEGAVLSARFDKLIQNYTQIEDLIGSREELCDKWASYNDAQRDAQSKIKALQARLALPGLQEDEVAQIKREMEAVKNSMLPWSRDSDSLDKQMSDAQMSVKDRATQRTLHFGSEIQSLQKLCDSASSAMKEKEAHLEELAHLGSTFDQKKEHVAGGLRQVQEKLKTAEVGKSSLQGLKDIVRQIEGIRDGLYLHNPEYEQFRELGRQIMATDPDNAAAVQKQLGQMNSEWERVQSLLAEKLQQYGGVINTWQQYTDAKEGVTRIVAETDPLVKQELAFTNQHDLKKALDQHKKAEFELHANQTHLDHMNRKGVQLLEDLKTIPNFDVSAMEGDLDDVNLKWETSNSVIEQHKGNLEAQLVCWDQAKSGLEEVGGWIGFMFSKLDDSLKHFNDTVSVESRLTKFKDEAPYYHDVMAEVNQKLRDLTQLNKNMSVPSLMSAQKDIESHFEKATSAANQLGLMMSTFSEEQQNLEQVLSDETEWMGQLKDALTKCDDVTGRTEDIIGRYETLKHLQKELTSHEHQISGIKEKSSSLQRRYPSSETTNLVKDGAVMAKKFESLMQQSNQIEESLLGQLEQKCAEAQQQQMRWLNAAKEKVSWCGDVDGDHHTVEVKLTTIKELEASFPEGEMRRVEAVNQLDAIRGVLPKARLGELETKSKIMDKDWQNLVKSLQQTKSKLETSMDQWQDYKKQYDTLSRWLKDTEGKIRTETTLKPDLASKQEQLEIFKAQNDSIQSYRNEFENLRALAQGISHASSDSRTMAQAGQLVKRYQTMASAIKEQVERCEQNIGEHGQYVSRYKAAQDWLSRMVQSLEHCSDPSRDESSLNVKLAALKDVLANKEEGFACVSAAIESGEKLYPNTSVEGREGIRRELRSLQDGWDSFSSSLSGVQKQLDSSRMELASFDTQFEQQSKWLADMEAQADAELELKTTLQEKKMLLQRYKSRHLDILSHQSLIDSVSDKGVTLASSHVQNKLKQLNNRYNQLCKDAEKCMKKAGDYVTEHQLYQDSYEQCRHLIAATRDKAAVCAEADGDKQTLQNRLERLQDVIASLQETANKIKSAHKQGEASMVHTSSQGQASIRQELNSLNTEWDALVTYINDTQHNLMQAIKAVELYDGSCETLHQWLREVEAQFRDCELKPTLHEKVTHLESFKKLDKEIHSKQDQFNHLQNITSQVQSSDSRLASYSSQLTAKYELLKNVAQDVISKWQEYVEEHRVFNDNHHRCVSWIDTMRKRLQVCADLVGDKPDVEDRKLKLQELVAESKDGANQFHQTTESGERLYSSTSAAGRDNIRQDIRNLRQQWEALHDEMSDTQHKLDIHLSLCDSYNENFDNFHKWLLDTEIKLKEHAESQATLPDKKALLHNHKFLHQDILSRENILDNLTDKANLLTQSAPSAKAKQFVGELKHKYINLCEASKTTLDKLEHAVQDHQQYQDVAKDFSDWLSFARDRLDACADQSGDKLSLKNKKDRLKEVSATVKEGEHKLNLLKKLMTTIAKNTSPQGQDTLHREADQMHKDWDDYLSCTRQTEKSLEQTLKMWEEYESKFEQITGWLGNMEEKVKAQDLKNTSGEKKAQVDKLKKLQEEISAYQPQMDRFSDNAQALSYASSDIRLSAQISQLTNRYQGLLSQLKDLINKWGKSAEEHELYDKHMGHFKEWIVAANQKLSACTQHAQDHHSLEERKALLQILFNEKDSGQQKLKLAIESGEKLYPDTAAAGREKLRGEMREANQDWEHFSSDLNETHNRMNSYLSQWPMYVDGHDHLLRWMSEMEASLRADTELKNTLHEKKQRLQMYKSLLGDISSHQRLMDSVIDKAQSLYQSTANPEVAEFITSTSSRLDKINLDIKNLIQKSEQDVITHQLYQDSLQAIMNWLSVMKDRLSLCSDAAGDRHNLHSKLDRLNDLIACVPEGSSKLKDFENRVQITQNTTGLLGRQNINTELNSVRLDWEEYSARLGSLKEGLAQAAHHWSLFESSQQNISSWLKLVEKQIKECPLKSTLKEKEEQLARYQDLLQDIRGHQPEVDSFTDDTQTLQHLTSETRVSNLVSQLTSRYEAVLTSSKELIKRLEQNVTDHRSYTSKSADCTQWLNKFRTKFSKCSESGSSRADLQDRMTRLQDLLRDQASGLTKLNQCIEIGESLYPNTAPEGREVIRQELRKLKLGHESLFDDLSTVQRKMDVSMVQWDSFDESYEQVESWLKQMELELEGAAPLKATLVEKKSQLHNYKAVQQDVMSYHTVIDSISGKVSSLVQASRDPELNEFVSRTGARYKKLCLAAKERVSLYESFVSEHQQYSDLYNSCVEWLNVIRGQLSSCSDVTGDQRLVQNQLDKIQEILNTKEEGEPMVKKVIALAETVLPHTAPQGKEVISRETEALRADWQAFIMVLEKTKKDLDGCMNHWQEFQTHHDTCTKWLQDVESQLRDVDLMATLQDKQMQLDKIKSLQTEVLNQQRSLNSLNDAAQGLSQISVDPNVADQASRLTTRYKTNFNHIKELCQKWQQYVLGHQAYNQSFNECRSWLNQVASKMVKVSDTSGDKSSLQQQLGQVQRLLPEKEEGMRKLQAVMDKLQTVLPNTSVAGRDKMRLEMQVLQQEYDSLSSRLTDAKIQLDGTLAQWTMYDNNVEQLERWLQEFEDDLSHDSALQTTLQEKQLQLDRVKVLHMNITSQQSAVDSLKEKAQNLKETSGDTTLGSQISLVVNRYETIVRKVKALNKECEKNLSEHQIYRDSYMDASSWLGAAMDKLGSSSDTQGDRQAIEYQLQKVEDIILTLEAGKHKLEQAQQKANAVIPGTSAEGQELIHKELNMLKSDFKSLESGLQDHKTALKSLREKWNKFEELHENLSRWVRDTENSIKASSDLKATLEQKVSQLNTHKIKHEEIIKRQEMFNSLTEQAHVLMKSVNDSKISTQITQLSSKYSALINLSRDFLKRCEQIQQDHDSYSHAHDRCRSWMIKMKDQLTAYSDISGGHHNVQAQLHKIQDFVIIKEEGQVYLQEVVTSGKRTMENTSANGREIIRAELQQLRAEWDRMMSEVTETKVNLESCLQQWSEYSRSHDQLSKWLGDVQRKLQDTQTRADLTEKKAELQKIKEVYQDIVSGEQMVESVVNKANNLAERSPASQSAIDTSHIQTSYNAVSRQAKGLLSNMEQNVSHHQNFQDSCSRFNSWLQATTEKLKACSDTCGDKAAIQAKIDKVQLLQAGLSEGKQLLSDATKAGEASMPSTSASGQVKIKHEIQAINRSFDQYSGHMVQTQSELEACLKGWEEYELNFQEFSKWVDETDLFLRSQLDLQSTVEEKKLQSEKYHQHKEEIISKQSSLDKVVKKAQALLKASADAKTWHAVSQLTSRYNGVVALAKDVSNNLERYCSDHQMYKKNHGLFTGWLKETKLRLKAISDDTGSKQALADKIRQVHEIQKFLDGGQTILQSVLDSCDKTVANTSPAGIHVIKKEAEEAKSEYGSLRTQVSQVRNKLDSAVSCWEEFEKLFQQLSRWISETEQKLGASADFKVDLPEKRTGLDRYKALEADILAHKEKFDRLEEKACQVKDGEPRSRAAQLRARYTSLIHNSKDIVVHVERQVGNNEEYRKSFNECRDWLAKVKSRFQHLADYSGDKKSLEDRLSRLRNFRTELGQGQELLTQMATLGNQLHKTTSYHGQGALKKEMDGLHEDWEAFISSVDDVEHNLKSCISSWTDLDREHNAFSDWLDKMEERKLKLCMDTKHDLTLKRQQLQEGEDLYDEILSYRSELNKIRNKAEAVAYRNSQGRISSNIAQLLSSYQALCASAKDTVAMLKENMLSHRLYSEMLDRAARWLKMMIVKVQACSDSTGDWHAIQDRIEDIKDITLHMDDGLQMVNDVCDQAETILPHTSLDGRKRIEGQVTELTNEWEKLNCDIVDCTAVLEGVQQRWHEYEEYYGSLVKWLAGVEDSLNAEPEMLAQLPDRKAQLEKYQLILADVQNYHRLVNELADRVANLEALCDNPEVTDSLAEIQDRYVAVNNRVKELVELLQKSYAEHLSFSKAQKECEKWLLAMSYKLMDHNSGGSKQESAGRHMDKHKLISREIEDYRQNVDTVSRLGQQLILSNPRQPQLATQIQAQLTNLEESYSNLQSTANQIGMTSLVSYSPQAILRYL